MYHVQQYFFPLFCFFYFLFSLICAVLFMFLGLMPFHCWSWYLSPICARIDIWHQFMFTLWCKEIITRECSELSGSKWGGLPIDQWFGSGLPQLCQLSPLDPSSSVFTFRGYFWISSRFFPFQEYFCTSILFSWSFFLLIFLSKNGTFAIFLFDFCFH